MSLKGAKLIWINKKEKSEKVIKLKNKKNFKFGYYMTNDFILSNPQAKPVHCEIVADAFNRISIINNSRQNPISLNGFRVKTRRLLLHGSKIRIFDDEFIWQFSKNGKFKSADEAKTPNELFQVEKRTPQKKRNENIPAPISEPWKKKNNLRIKERLSAHSFMQQREQETDESDSENKSSENKINTQNEHNLVSSAKKRSLSEQLKRKTFECVTPIKDWDENASLIKFDSTLNQNKENTPRNRHLSKLITSGTLVTSFSPHVYNDSILSSSFAYVKSNKNTPKSVYGTPKSVLSAINDNHDGDLSADFIKFSTPTAKCDVVSTSMYLIDLTTPSLHTKNSQINKIPNSVTDPQNTPTSDISKVSALKSALKISCANESRIKSTKKVKMACSENLSSIEQSPDKNEHISKHEKLTPDPSANLRIAGKDLAFSEISIKKNNFKNMNQNNSDKIICNSSNLSVTKSIDENKDSYSIETIDDTIDLNNTSYISGNESQNSIIELSDDSIPNIRSTPKNLTSTPKSQLKNPNISQSLMKKALLSSARKAGKNCGNRSLISKTTSPVRTKRLSLSVNNIFSNSRRQLSKEKSPKFDADTKTKTVRESALFSKTLINNGKSNFSFNKSSSSFHLTPKKHSCENIKKNNLLITPVSICLKRISTNSISSTSTQKNDSNKTLRNPKFQQKLENTNSQNSRKETLHNVTKTNEIQTNNEDNSFLNETFTVDLNLENKSKSHLVSENNLSNANIMYLARENKSEYKGNMSTSKEFTKISKVIATPNKTEIKTTNDHLSEKKSMKNSIQKDTTPVFKGVKEMMKTPRILKTPKMGDIKYVNKTPKLIKTPNFKGIKETLKTPKLSKDNSPNLRGLRSLLKTPKSENKNVDVEEVLTMSKECNKINFDEVKEMAKSPVLAKSVVCNIEVSNAINNMNGDESQGLDNIFKTPSAKTIMVYNKANENTTIKKSLKSFSENILKPAEFNLEEDIDPISTSALFENSLKDVSYNCTSSPYLSPTEIFDNLVGRQKVETSYSNKKSHFTYNSVPVLELHDQEDIVKSDIQNWVENISVEGMAKSVNEVTTINSHVSDVSNDLFDMSGIDILNETCNSVDSENESNKLKLLKKVIKGKISGNSLKTIDFKNQSNSDIEKSFPLGTTKSKSKLPRESLDNNQVVDESFNLKLAKEKRTKERTFENFEDKPNLNWGKSFTPELPKCKVKLSRKTFDNNHILNESFDLLTAKKEREMNKAFENFKDQPNFNKQKSFTPEVRNSKSKSTRKTFGNNQILDETFNLKEAKEKREREQVFENFENQTNLNKQKSFTPEVYIKNSKITRKTVGNNQAVDNSFDLMAEKKKREMDQAFKNFEDQPSMNKQKSFTPEICKTKSKLTRKTVDNNQMRDELFDLKEAKEYREIEQAFENFEDQPNLNKQKSFTPEVHKINSKLTRQTMGNNQALDETLDLLAAKEYREMEQAFENFEDQPNLIKQKSFTPEVRKINPKLTRKTMGNNQALDETFDLLAAKEYREMEQAFENFEDQPNLNKQKSFTPEVRKINPKLTRKTMGNNQALDETLDLLAAKEYREMEQAFENFEDQPNLIKQKSFTPEVRKINPKLTRKTMGNNQALDETFDLLAAKEYREMEQAFENFEDQPNLNKQKSFTPEVRKINPKLTRKTMGNNQALDETFDLLAAKKDREMKQEFENFEEQQNLNKQKSFTPQLCKTKPKIPRKTMGNVMALHESFDLVVEKKKREMEQAFENFEDQPNLNKQKSFTPEVRKINPKLTRKTMGNNQALDETFDLLAAKEYREMEQAFENFEDQPNLIKQKSFTPEVRKINPKLTRKTMGNNQALDETFDFLAAKKDREMEQEFENFEDQQNLNKQKSFTPKLCKTKPKIIRKTMGNHQALHKSFDLVVEKKKREMEQAFENFEDQQNLNKQKSFTPKLCKTNPKTARKTMGNNQVLHESFDLMIEKEKREMEQAFENFEDQPNLNKQKSFTPEVYKKNRKITRKTVGNNQAVDNSFVLIVEKEKREMEQAFENFENQPNMDKPKSFTPELRKTKPKSTRKTIGNHQMLDESFDLMIEKEKREMEKAFENFEDQPHMNKQKSFTPEVHKSKLKSTRKTVGNHQMLDESFDLKEVKEKREMEQAFENFEDQPNLNKQKSFTPEVYKKNRKVTRKTVGNNQAVDNSFDLIVEKEKREMEQAFENFKNQPNMDKPKSFTPELRKTKPKSTRKTIDNHQMLDESFDLMIEKEKREMEQAFENFEDQPHMNKQKSFTPEVHKSKLKSTRKTVGNHQMLDESFDLKEVKEKREMEQAFENFEDQPNLNKQKSFTPEVYQKNRKITRKTLGNNQAVDNSFDLMVEKGKREMEQAFENFEDQPNLNKQKSFTPELRKINPKMTRKTMGNNNQALDETFDLLAAKEYREMEHAFENLENQPNMDKQKSFTPELRKTKPRSTRKTTGNNQILNESLNLNEAKEKREIEQAFENFEDQQNWNYQKSSTPEVPKNNFKLSRKTMGSDQVLNESFDLNAAKKQRVIEQAFENFKDQPNVITQKSITPEFSKSKLKIKRRTIGNNQILNKSFDLFAFKKQADILAKAAFDRNENKLIQKTEQTNVTECRETENDIKIKSKNLVQPVLRSSSRHRKKQSNEITIIESNTSQHDSEEDVTKEGKSTKEKLVKKSQITCFSKKVKYNHLFEDNVANQIPKIRGRSKKVTSEDDNEIGLQASNEVAEIFLKNSDQFLQANLNSGLKKTSQETQRIQISKQESNLSTVALKELEFSITNNTGPARRLRSNSISMPIVNNNLLTETQTSKFDDLAQGKGKKFDDNENENVTTEHVIKRKGHSRKFKEENAVRTSINMSNNSAEKENLKPLEKKSESESYFNLKLTPEAKQSPKRKKPKDNNLSSREPQFKTPNSAAPKTRAARRLRSNSTSTSVLLNDSSILTEPPLEQKSIEYIQENLQKDLEIQHEKVETETIVTSKKLSRRRLPQKKTKNNSSDENEVDEIRHNESKSKPMRQGRSKIDKDNTQEERNNSERAHVVIEASLEQKSIEYIKENLQADLGIPPEKVEKDITSKKLSRRRQPKKKTKNNSSDENEVEAIRQDENKTKTMRRGRSKIDKVNTQDTKNNSEQTYNPKIVVVPDLTSEECNNPAENNNVKSLEKNSELDFNLKVTSEAKESPKRNKPKDKNLSSTEPQFKTPNSAAPKTRAARRLRSNSTSTSVLLNDSSILTEPPLEQKSIEYIQENLQKDLEIQHGNVETETIVTSKKLSRRRLPQKKTKNDSSDENEVEEIRHNESKAKPMRQGRSKIDKDNTQEERNNSERAHIVIETFLEQKSIEYIKENLQADLEIPPEKVEKDITSKKLSRRRQPQKRTKNNSSDENEVEAIGQDENKTKTMRRGRSKIDKVNTQDTKNNSEQTYNSKIVVVSDLISEEYNNPAENNNLKSLEKNSELDFNLKVTSEPKESPQRNKTEANSLSSTEPQFKTPNSSAPKTRATRRLRSNSTSTPIISDDNNVLTELLFEHKSTEYIEEITQKNLTILDKVESEIPAVPKKLSRRQPRKKKNEFLDENEVEEIKQDENKTKPVKVYSKNDEVATQKIKGNIEKFDFKANAASEIPPAKRLRPNSTSTPDKLSGEENVHTIKSQINLDNTNEIVEFEKANINNKKLENDKSQSYIEIDKKVVKKTARREKSTRRKKLNMPENEKSNNIEQNESETNKNMAENKESELIEEEKQPSRKRNRRNLLKSTTDESINLEIQTFEQPPKNISKELHDMQEENNIEMDLKKSPQKSRRLRERKVEINKSLDNKNISHAEKTIVYPEKRSTRRKK